MLHVLTYVMKDTVTSLLKWVAPICCIASAVPEYGHFPSSSLSHPTVSWTPGMSYGDKVQRSSQITQHVQYNHDYRIRLMRLTLAAITGDIQQNLATYVMHNVSQSLTPAHELLGSCKLIDYLLHLVVNRHLGSLSGKVTPV